MGAKQMARGLAHALHVQRPVHERDATRGQRRARRPIQDAVAVGARERGIARMEMIRAPGAPSAVPHPRGNSVFAPSTSARSRACGAGIEMRDLAARVHAGIRTSGRGQLHVVVADAAERRLQ